MLNLPFTYDVDGKIMSPYSQNRQLDPQELIAFGIRALVSQRARHRLKFQGRVDQDAVEWAMKNETTLADVISISACR